MAKSSTPTAAGRPEVTIACAVMAFQSTTASAWADTAQLKHPHTIRLVSLRSIIIFILSSSFACLVQCSRATREHPGLVFPRHFLSTVGPLVWLSNILPLRVHLTSF